MNEDQQHPPMSGNDDLAKTLNDSLQFEETPMTGGQPDAQAAPADDDMKMPTFDPAAGDPNNEPYTPPAPTTQPAEETPAAAAPAEVEAPAPAPTPEIRPAAPAPKKQPEDSSLDNLKSSALQELRPLVKKLKLPPEEQFDTLLLIIRSTDDQSLLEQAHEAAKQIQDETERAQALLDVIKEIDYFSSKR